MVKLLIIADDFTGALDTGIQFAKKGIETQVFTGEVLQAESISETARVLVVDSETRPMTKEAAHGVVAGIVGQAAALKIPVIYKKTDSALRGNVGSELEAVLDGTGEHEIFFIPAFPDVGRVTRNGIHYIDGEPLEKSSFGQDPFDPMRSSEVVEILKEKASCSVVSIDVEQKIPELCAEKTILVFDASTNNDILARAGELKEKNKLHLLAGCAGFASFLPKLLHLEGTETEKPRRTECFYVACGSLNAITQAQVEYAYAHGFHRINLWPEQKLCPEYYETEDGKQFLAELKRICLQEKKVIVDTFDLPGRENTAQYAGKHQIQDIRFSISACHGRIVRDLLEDSSEFTVLMTGGDTLMGFMKQIGVNQIYPVEELAQGTVLSLLKWKGRTLQVISKSGGFGKREVFTDIADMMLY
ncbi:MAG: four-carbon acid sugar kinase family protein [Lachnospiraceae bacterium]|nr:four-carbon acid sugar kinase family protein [Lachnospiraceae bacterium]